MDKQKEVYPDDGMYGHIMSKMIWPYKGVKY